MNNLGTKSKYFGRFSKNTSSLITITATKTGVSVPIFILTLISIVSVSVVFAAGFFSLTQKSLGESSIFAASVEKCLPIYANHNNKDDSTRFNIVFIGVGFQSRSDLIAAAGRAIDLDGTASSMVESDGLMQIPAFKNNRSKLNFWYVDNILSFTDDSPQNVGSELYQFDWISDCQGILPNRVIPIFIYPGKTNSVSCENYQTSLDCLADGRDKWCSWSTSCNKNYYPYASMGRAYVTLYDCVDSNSNCNINSYPNLQNANIHELLHTIPCLGDEYGRWGSANPNPPVLYTGTLTGSGIFEFYKGNTYVDCLANAPWKNMIGNDCGSSGVVDCFSCAQPISFVNGIDVGVSCCSPGKECTLEIGCFEGGLYADKGIWRASSGGVLRSPYLGQMNGIDYINSWNQEIIKAVIDKGPAPGKWEKNVALNFWRNPYGPDCDVSATFVPPPPPPICTESWTCGSWSACSNSTQTRTCTDANACGTTVNKPATTQSCTSACTENWQCTAWSSCQPNSTQTRTCTDSNSCGTTSSKPAETQACIYTPPVITVPTLTTSVVSSVTANTAIANGAITATGGANPTVRGFNYGLTTNYGLNIIASGSFTTGVFTASLSNLTCNTTYHFRAYATNSAGTGGGSDQSFTTSACPVACTPNWSCTSWLTCSVGGTQARSCTDTNTCGVMTGKPATTQSCTYVPLVIICTPNWTCTAWSACSPSRTQNRTCTDGRACNTDSGKPTESQSCAYTPPVFITFPPGLAANAKIKLNSSPAVYILDSQGKRHLFSNEATYWTWYSGSWSVQAVKAISQSDFDNLSLGARATARPGINTIKFDNSGKIYTVTTGNKLCEVISYPELATKAITIQSGFENDYLKDSTCKITQGGKLPNGSLIKYKNSTDIFYIDNGNKRKITPTAFTDNNFKTSAIITNIDPTITYPEGDPINAKIDSIANMGF